MVKSVDRSSQTIVVHDEKSKTDITVSLSSLTKGSGLSKTKEFQVKDLKPGAR